MGYFQEVGPLPPPSTDLLTSIHVLIVYKSMPLGFLLYHKIHLIKSYLIIVVWWPIPFRLHKWCQLDQPLDCDDFQETVLGAICGYCVQSYQHSLTIFGRESWNGTHFVGFFFIWGSYGYLKIVVAVFISIYEQRGRFLGNS